MPIRLILMGLVILVLIYWAAMPHDASARKVLKRWVVRIGIAAVVLLLVRMGLPLLAVIGAALLAAARFVLPTLLRLLPLWLGRRAIPNPNAAPGYGGPAPGFQKPTDMTREHALEILNLHRGASRDEIINAHRELIKKVHPDRGGSSYLAAEVNRARDVLLS
jgi:DnaJ homolog subfamily C member 19